MAANELKGLGIVANGKAGAPLGNRNGAKNKLWEQALVRAVRPKDLEDVAKTVIQAAKDGQPWAVTELGNRLDGKAVQPIDHTFEEKAPSLSDALLAYVAQGGKPEDYGKETVQ